MYVGELISLELNKMRKSQVWLAEQICQKLDIPLEKKPGTRSFLQQIIAGKRKLPDRWHSVIEQCLSLKIGQLSPLAPKNPIYAKRGTVFSLEIALERMELLRVLSEENIVDDDLAEQLWNAQKQVNFRFSRETWQHLLQDYKEYFATNTQSPTA